MNIHDGLLHCNKDFLVYRTTGFILQGRSAKDLYFVRVLRLTELALVSLLCGSVFLAYIKIIIITNPEFQGGEGYVDQPQVSILLLHLVGTCMVMQQDLHRQRAVMLSRGLNPVELQSVAERLRQLKAQVAGYSPINPYVTMQSPGISNPGPL